MSNIVIFTVFLICEGFPLCTKGRITTSTRCSNNSLWVIYHNFSPGENSRTRWQLRTISLCPCQTYWIVQEEIWSTQKLLRTCQEKCYVFCMLKRSWPVCGHFICCNTKQLSKTLWITQKVVISCRNGQYIRPFSSLLSIGSHMDMIVFERVFLPLLQIQMPNSLQTNSVSVSLGQPDVHPGESSVWQVLVSSYKHSKVLQIEYPSTSYE